MSRFLVDHALISALWDALNAPPPNNHIPNMAIKSIVKTGWAAGYQVGDVLEAMDRRVSDRLDSDALQKLSTALALPWRQVYSRPSARSTLATGSIMIAATDLAKLLINLEKLGFAIDPLPLVEALRPAFVKKTYLNESELAVFWFKRERHKSPPIDLISAVAEDRDSTKLTIKRSTTGYTAAYRANKNGAISLIVDPPRHRRATPTPSQKAFTT
jgi:hypothetical protein